MRKYLQSTATKTGLAIFAMLFGSGNLIYPCVIGILSGKLTPIGLLGFLFGSIVIPLTGLISMVYFDGSYNKFFERIGKVPGQLFVFVCMLISGPLLVMPRIITFSYEMMRPFICNYVSLISFTVFFATVTFICAYKKNSLINLIGKYLSPIKLFSLITILIIGLFVTHDSTTATTTYWQVFSSNLLRGYNTLDLLGMIFFSYIIISILKDTTTGLDKKTLTKIMLKAGAIGGGLLATIYTGLAYLGYWHGKGLEDLEQSKMFIQVLLKLLGGHAAFIISFTIFFACLTTIISLSSVVSEYIHKDISKKKIDYKTSLVIVLLITGIVSQFELAKIMSFSEPFVNIIYPVLIVLTLCNLAYQIWGFKYVKIPVLLTFVASTFWFAPAAFSMLACN